MFTLLTLLLSAHPPVAADLPVDDRCALVGAVVNAKAKHETQNMRLEETTLAEYLGKKVSVENRTAINPFWRIGRKERPLFGAEEKCNDGTYVLAQTLPPPSEARLGIDHLIEIILVRTSRTSFTFEQRVRIRIGSPPPPGVRVLWAVPPAYFRGVVERVNGVWRARVTKAVFAT